MENKIEQPENEIKTDETKKISDTFQIVDKKGQEAISDFVKLKTESGVNNSKIEKLTATENSTETIIATENSIANIEKTENGSLNDCKELAKKDLEQINANIETANGEITNFIDAYKKHKMKNNITENFDKSDLTTQDGSITGKFKDAKTLLEAYNNLQAEFTRKSQKLASLEKQMEELKKSSGLNEADNNSNNVIHSEKVKGVETQNDNLIKSQNVFQKSEEFNTIDEFVSRNSDSEKYKKMLTEIAESNSLSNLPNKYQLAYDLIKVAEGKLAENLSDPNFVDKIIENNDLVKSKVITNYLSNLNSHSAPSIMSGTSPSVYFSPSSGKPTTIKEAGELFSKMLK